jgi:hypothetical protein
VSLADLAAMRAAYVAYLRHSEFHDLHRLLPRLCSLYLDGCTELRQLLKEGMGNDHDKPFSFSGSTLSVAYAAHDMETLERLLTWCTGTTCGSLDHTHHHPLSRGVSRRTTRPSPWLAELRLSGCRSLYTQVRWHA